MLIITHGLSLINTLANMFQAYLFTHTITLGEFYLKIYCTSPYIYKVTLSRKGFDNTKYSLIPNL